MNKEDALPIGMASDEAPSAPYQLTELYTMLLAAALEPLK